MIRKEGAVMQLIFTFLGRIFISLIFIFSATGKVFNWDFAHQELIGRLCDWISFTSSMPKVQQCIDILLPLAPMLLIVSTIFEGVGGILVLLGIKPKVGAALLILFLIPATIIMHASWMVSPVDKTLQMVMFFKNLAILGGLFILVGCGGSKVKTSK